MRALVTKLYQPALVRYLLVGVTAFVVEYGSFFVLLTGLDWAVWLANGASFLLALLTSFSLNRLWTFATHAYSKRAVHQFGLYGTLAVINLGVTLVFVQILVLLHLNPRWAKLIAMVITSTWNFLLFKLFIFAHRHEGEH